jgi:carbamoyl-phosphate synthase small subunit
LKAYLILEDGSVYEGKSIGAVRDCTCEVVFNTAMTGYVETLSDPSYFGQGVILTYPIVGSYGVNFADMESGRIWVSCLIVRELAEQSSNFRKEATLSDYLCRYGIPGISGIDTRALTKKIRERGTMAGFLTTQHFDIDKVVSELKEYKIKDAVKSVSRKSVKHLENDGKKVALMDFGAKDNIASCLHKRGLDVTVYPDDTTAEEIIASKPDGIMLSNGPGNPEDNEEIIKNIKKLYDTDIPIFGICLGHQLMALATGAKTEKLKYGHRGANHPVKDLERGRVYITSQNHGYVVSEIDESVAKISHVNVNDKTIEGLKYLNKNIFTVQFHPEASPGPQDTEYLFDEFIEMMGGVQNA